MKKILTHPSLITLGLILIALLIGAASSPDFRSASYLLSKTSIYVPIGILALAMTLVITAGQIDLSVGSGAVLTMVICALAFQAGLPMWAVVPLALVVGTLLGVLNGLLVGYLRLPSLVVTLATLALYRGVAQMLMGEGTVGKFPSWFTGVDYVTLGGFPVPFITLVALTVLTAIILGKTTLGRRIMALGTNESATRYSGIDVRRLKLTVFAISGLSMGVAALFQTSQIGVVDYKQFVSAELFAITAVVLGGTSIFGGRGTALGTFLAMLLLVVVRSALGINQVRTEYQLTIIGGMLILSVLMTNLLVAMTSRRRPSAT